jgi:hypothetical protein
VNDELVQVWQQRDGTWRWRYVVLDHTELRSNRGYESSSEAVRSARQAYPGVVILGPVEEALTGDDRPRREARMLRVAAASATAVFLLLALGYALGDLRRPVRRGR